jgi:hypothetical protein
MTLAQQLKGMFQGSRSSQEVEDNTPEPLNKEALEVILNRCKELAPTQGMHKVFIDNVWGHYCFLDNENRFFECDEVLSLLEDPALGFKLEIDDTGDGCFVNIIWDEDNEVDQVNPTYVEVEPPKEIKEFVKGLVRTPR